MQLAIQLYIYMLSLREDLGGTTRCRCCDETFEGLDDNRGISSKEYNEGACGSSTNTEPKQLIGLCEVDHGPS